MIIVLYRVARRAWGVLMAPIYSISARLIFAVNGVQFCSQMKIRGFLDVMVSRRGAMSIGTGFRANSGERHNIIGRQQRCKFWVDGILTIGDNVGVSGVAIICHREVTIESGVLIGGNTVIYDTDFHSLKHEHRADQRLDRENVGMAPVRISRNAFIGAHSTILKGVTIGENAIVGACSVVTRDIPANEIWAGNPAAPIRKLAAPDRPPN